MTAPARVSVRASLDASENGRASVGHPLGGLEVVGGTDSISEDGVLDPGTYFASAVCGADAYFYPGSEAIRAADARYSVSLSLTEELTLCEGAEARWVGGRSGAFADPANWDPEQVPAYEEAGPCDTALFDGGGQFAIDFAPTPAASRLAPRGGLRRDVGRVVVRRGAVQAANALLQLFDPSPLDPSLIVGSRGSLLLGTGADVVAQDVRVDAGSSLELLDAFQLGCNALRVEEDGRVDVRAGLLTCEWIDSSGAIDLQGGAAVLEATEMDAGNLRVSDGARLQVGPGSAILQRSQPSVASVGGGLSGADTLFEVIGPLLLVKNSLSVNSAGRLKVATLDLVDNASLQIATGGLVETAGRATIGDAFSGAYLRAGGELVVEGELEIRQGTVEILERAVGDPVAVRDVRVIDGRLKLRNGARLETTRRASVAGPVDSGFAFASVGSRSQALAPAPARWTVLDELAVGVEPVGFLTLFESEVEAGSVPIGPFGEVFGQGTLRVRSTPPFTGAGAVHNEGTIYSDVVIDGSFLDEGGTIERIESGDGSAPQGLAPGAQFEGALAGGVLTVAATTPTQSLPPLALKAKTKLTETKAKGAKLKVTRAGDRSQPLRVAYRAGGTAASGVDYEELPGTLEIPAGKKSATIALRPFRDGLVEPPETIEIELLPGDGYSLPRASSLEIELLSKDWS